MNKKKIIAAMAGFAFALALGQPLRAQTDIFKSLGSDDVLKMAFEHNPSLHATLLDEEQAAAAVRAEEGLYPFMLQLEGGFTHSSSPTLGDGGDVNHRSSDTTVLGAQVSKTLPIGTQTSLSVEGTHQASSGPSMLDTGGGQGAGYGMNARLAVTQPILRGAGTTVVEAGLRQALKSEELTRYRTQRAASELVSEILNTYWELWYAERALEIEIKARDLARTQLEEVEQRVEVGDSAPVDALPFETRLATLEESIISAKTTRDSLSVRLAGLIGFRSGKMRMSPDTGSEPYFSAASLNAEEETLTALTKSPEIREQIASIALAEEREKTAGESMRQRLDLITWVEANTLGNGEVPPVFEQYAQGEAYSAHVGLLYELPLDSTRLEAQRASARLDVDIANQQLLASRDQVRVNVMTVIDRITSTRVRMELAERTFDIARRQAQAERERYELGAAIFVQVREAEEAVREAELRAVRARVDLAQAELELDHLTGKLIERYSAMLRPEPVVN